MHCLSGYGCGCNCDFDSCCESQIATKRHFSTTSCDEIPSDFWMRSIVGVLLQENPGLTIRIGMADSDDLCPDVCCHGPGMSLLWATATSFVYLPSLLEMWPSVAG
jgi:hypothetical protein